QGRLYTLWFAQRFLFGQANAPHMPLVDLNLREKSILAAIVVAVFGLGLFPDEPLRKTELAARQYQQMVPAERSGGRLASTPIAVTSSSIDANPSATIVTSPSSPTVSSPAQTSEANEAPR